VTVLRRIQKKMGIALWVLLLVGVSACSAPLYVKMQKRAAAHPQFDGNRKAEVPDTLIMDDFSDWEKHWAPEAERPTQVRYLPEEKALDVVAPAGFTLWLKQPLDSGTTVRYQICAVAEGGTYDRCSDLSCFWMATDPQHPADVFAGATERAGTLVGTYGLRMYYMAYGANANTATRFRRYDGDYQRFLQFSRRPPVLKEYTDPDCLIVPNHWYVVEIRVRNGVTEYWCDDKQLVCWVDPQPLQQGWFAFRTTQNHFRVRSFSVTRP
jgi:hypothetical protein